MIATDTNAIPLKFAIALQTSRFASFLVAELTRRRKNTLLTINPGYCKLPAILSYGPHK